MFLPKVIQNIEKLINNFIMWITLYRQYKSIFENNGLGGYNVYVLKWRKRVRIKSISISKITDFTGHANSVANVMLKIVHRLH